MMKLKVYADRMSQPSRAVILFCKLNEIDFEEIKVDLSKRQQLSKEFADVNPLRKVPAIVDGRFKLFESHAILIYLACAFPGVADHWYPGDLSKRAKIHSVLDWHHSNLRRGAAEYVLYTALGPALGLPLNPKAAAEAEKVVNDGDHSRILGPYKKVQQWVDHTKNATSPHFEEVHTILFKAKGRLQKLAMTANSENDPQSKTPRSRM